MCKHTHPIHLKVLAGVFTLLANVSLLQQLSVHGVTDDPMAVLASLTREQARNAVKAKLAAKRPVRKVRTPSNAAGIRKVTRYRRPRISISDIPPPVMSGPKNIPEQSRCGDDLILLSEQCDDGNTQPEDGCTPDCKIEAGYICYGQPSICIERCGDSTISFKEKCDDGNLDDGDGCSSQCRIEFGYSCTGTPSTCKINPVCGNRVVETPETCDDGNIISLDGCSAACV